MGLRRHPPSRRRTDLAYGGRTWLLEQDSVRAAIAVSSSALAFALKLQQTTRPKQLVRRRLPSSKGAVSCWMEQSLHSARQHLDGQGQEGMEWCGLRVTSSAGARCSGGCGTVLEVLEAAAARYESAHDAVTAGLLPNIASHIIPCSLRQRPATSGCRLVQRRSSLVACSALFELAAPEWSQGPLGASCNASVWSVRLPAGTD